MADHEIKALDASTWDDFEALVQRMGGLFGGCWCAWFHDGVPDGQREGEDNHHFKERMVRTGVAHAALVYDGDMAVAWAEYGRPDELPNIHHRKQYDAEAATAGDAAPDFRITCIRVDKQHRRLGLARVALDGAVDLIARAGGGLVEGYPQDFTDHPLAQQGKPVKINPSFIYNGTRRMYEEAGFTYVRPKGKNHCVMTRTVSLS